MKPRDIAFLGALLALLLGVGTVILGNPGGQPPGGEPEAPLPAPDLVAGSGPAPVPLERAAAPVTAAPYEARPGIDQPTGRVDGAIRGDISLSTAVIGDLDKVHIRIQEALNQAEGSPDRQPFTRTLVEEIVPELGTPQFFCDHVPFSEYGYVVRAFAPGFNGSEQFVQVTATQPIADVVLSVTAATPFSVLLRDQLRAPVLGERVFLVPVGEPRGRSILQKEADGFGVAVFEAVLGGGYEIRVGAMNEPLAEPVTVDVVPHAGVRSTTVVVPRGFDFTVIVQSIYGWGIEGAELVLYATDQVQYRKQEGTTDFSGKFVFEHLPVGSYQLNVTAEGFQRWSRNVSVSETGPPEQTIVRMVPR